MAVFAYKGVNAKGKTVKGTRDADSPKALKNALRRDGVMITEVLEQSEAAKRNAKEIDFKRLLQRVSTADVAMATRQLAVLIRSGVPLVESMGALTDQLEQPELKAAFSAARDKVNEGKNFADALKAHPKIFPSLYVSMVEAGEASGTLDQVLVRLAEFLDAQAKLKSKVAGALAYPAIMSIIGVIILVIMMTVVVPRVTSIFEDFDKALPWYTELLIFMSNMLGSFWWLFIILAAGAWYVFRRWKNTTKGRLQWDTWLLKAPVFGKLFLMIAVSRFARTLGTLLKSGVPVLKAMDITQRILGNQKLINVVNEAQSSVREGEGIAKPLKDSGAFPPIVTHMISIGEQSGQLEEMLEHVAVAYDHQVETRVDIVTSLMEPIIIIVMGGSSGFITMAILMPLLQINEFMQ